MARGVEVEAQPCLGAVAEAHRAEVHGVRVDVVEGDVQRAGQLFRVEQLVGPRNGVVEELHDASGGALGDGLDVVVVEGHACSMMNQISKTSNKL